MKLSLQLIVRRCPILTPVLIPISAVCAFFLAAIGSASTVCAADPWSVEFFNSRKAQWETMAGELIHVEGRLGPSSKGQFRLLKCDMAFLVPDIQLRTLVGARAVEVSGRIRKDGTKLTFDVSQIQMKPTDIEQLDSRMAKHRNAPAADWYELADWAEKRSRFYDDGELAKKVLVARSNGVKQEELSLPKDDGEARISLAGKMKQFQLPDSSRMALLHEGYRQLFQKAAKSDPVDAIVFEELAARISVDLPGSTTILKAVDAELAQKYKKDAIGTYRSAKESERNQLHRFLYRDVVLTPIVTEAVVDGRNGDAIASRIEKAVPEETTLAEEYRQRRRAWRIERAATATRQEIEQLAAELRSLGKGADAHTVLMKWVDAREARAREDGSVGLLQHAEDRLILLRDEAGAVALLKEAHKLDPSFEDVKVKLTRLGYKFDRGAWTRESVSHLAPINSGPGNAKQIEVGISASQLLTLQQRRPSAISRAITNAGVTEIWFYESGNLIFRLEKIGNAREFKLVEIGTGEGP